MFTRFNRIQAWRVTDGETDRRTDRHLATAQSPLCIASRCKNESTQMTLVVVTASVTLKTSVTAWFLTVETWNCVDTVQLCDWRNTTIFWHDSDTKCACNFFIVKPPSQSGSFTRWRCFSVCLFVHLFVRLSVVNAYLSGNGLTGPAAQ